MKKLVVINLLIIAMIVAVVNSGCSRDDDQDMDPDDNPSGYFVKAKVDGKLVEFKTATLVDGAIATSIQGVYDLSVSGARQMSGQSGLEESISVILRDTSPITQKSYSGLAPFDYGFKGVIIGYSHEIENRAYTTDVNAANSFLEITEIKETTLKGKFNGVVKDFLSGETRTITEGEFFVKRSN